MDFTDWYAVALGSLVTFLFVVGFFLWISKLKNVLCRRVQRYLKGAGKRTSFGFLFLLPFLIGNVVGLALYVNDARGFIKRSGLISTINLVPLSLGGRMNPIADRCGIDLATYAGMHRWVGRLAIVEAVIHAIAGLSFRKLDLHAVPDVAALVAATTLIFVLLSGPLRRYAHEAFLWLHMLFAIAVVISIYLHLPSKKLLEPPTVYLLSGACLLAFVGAVQFAHVLYRNIRHRRPLNGASVRLITFKRKYKEEIPVPDAVHVHVRLSAPWALRAGQYVYLCIPQVSYTSFAQLHPFYIAWGYRDEHGRDYAVFVVQKGKGFTKSIFSHVDNGLNGSSEMKAVIDGPYGKELNLGLFGTVLLFATGIGIAAQLPYVAQLLAEYQGNETRRIALFWQVESEIQTAWVADRMQVLLDQDIYRILDIRLFVVGGFLSSTTPRGHRVQIGERIDMTYAAVDAERLIKSEIKSKMGGIVVSLCVDNQTSSQIRQAVRRFDFKIHIKELDFLPKGGTRRDGLLARAARLGQRTLDV